MFSVWLSSSGGRSESQIWSQSHRSSWFVRSAFYHHGEDIQDCHDPTWRVGVEQGEQVLWLVWCRAQWGWNEGGERNGLTITRRLHFDVDRLWLPARPWRMRATALMLVTPVSSRGLRPLSRLCSLRLVRLTFLSRRAGDSTRDIMEVWLALTRLKLLLSMEKSRSRFGEEALMFLLLQWSQVLDL